MLLFVADDTNATANTNTNNVGEQQKRVALHGCDACDEYCTVTEMGHHDRNIIPQHKLSHHYHFGRIPASVDYTKRSGALYR